MKKFKFLLIVLLLSLVLWGCKGSVEDSEPGYNDDGEMVELADSSPTRKIIYTVYATIKTDNIEETINDIQNSLDDDEWVAEENITSTSASFIVRVKSDRIDDYISSITITRTMSDYSKKSTDVSIMYQDNVYEISALEAELVRLNELYADASMSDMIELNRRISEVTKELNKLKGLLREYDSLVDYSEIHLSINGPKAKDNTSFGGRITIAITGGWNAVLSLLQGIVVVFFAILPFMIIIVPVGAIIYVVYKVKLKKSTKDQE